jgi:uncharacterized protein (DUF1697 family)
MEPMPMKPATGKDQDRVAALLRAVNVGGRKLRMAELRTMLQGGGYADVETLLASGNVLLRTPREGLEGLAAGLTKQIQEQFGLHTDVLIRSHEELRRALASHPFAAGEAEGSRLHVVFLDALPPADRIAALDPDRSPPDRVAVIGREAYLHYPGGSARSKLTLAWLERQLGVIGTGRNLNTVRKLVDLTAPERD